MFRGGWGGGLGPRSTVKNCIKRGHQTDIRISRLYEKINLRADSSNIIYTKEEVILIPPKIYFHISKYQTQISKCLQKIKRSPYINIFKAINQQMLYVSLKLCWDLRQRKPIVMLKKRNILLKKQRSNYWKPKWILKKV